MNIDWTKIEGYREDMSADEKLALLDNYEPEEPANPPAPTEPAVPKGYISKAMYDKVASDLSNAKKQLRERMTSAEQAEADRVAKQTAMEQELESLRRDKTLSGYKASYLAQGYDEALADEAATAMVDGDMESVFDVMAKHRANMEKSIRAKILKDTPVPPAGSDPDAELKKKKEEAALRADFGLAPRG